MSQSAPDPKLGGGVKRGWEKGWGGNIFFFFGCYNLLFFFFLSCTRFVSSSPLFFLYFWGKRENINQIRNVSRRVCPDFFWQPWGCETLRKTPPPPQARPYGWGVAIGCRGSLVGDSLWGRGVSMGMGCLGSGERGVSL